MDEQHIPRFIPVISGSGLTAVKDTLHGRLVCAFFMDKQQPEAMLSMIKICCDALNAAVAVYPLQSSTAEGVS